VLSETLATVTICPHESCILSPMPSSTIPTNPAPRPASYKIFASQSATTVRMVTTDWHKRTPRFSSAQSNISRKNASLPKPTPRPKKQWLSTSEFQSWFLIEGRFI
jgi:hypothetical protein